MRYVFNSPTLLTFDVTIFLIMFSAFLGSAFTLREGKHVRLDFHELAPRYGLPSRILSILSNVIIIVFWLLATYTAFRDTITAYKFSQVTQSYLPPPDSAHSPRARRDTVLIQLLVDTLKLCVFREGVLVITFLLFLFFLFLLLIGIPVAFSLAIAGGVGMNLYP